MHWLKISIFHMYIFILILRLQIQPKHTVASPGIVIGSLLPLQVFGTASWYLDTSKMGIHLDRLMGALQTHELLVYDPEDKRSWIWIRCLGTKKFGVLTWCLCHFATFFPFSKINFITLLSISGIISISWKHFSTDYTNCCKWFGDVEC